MDQNERLLHERFSEQRRQDLRATPAFAGVVSRRATGGRPWLRMAAVAAGIAIVASLIVLTMRGRSGDTEVPAAQEWPQVAIDLPVLPGEVEESWQSPTESLLVLSVEVAPATSPGTSDPHREL